MAGLKTEGFSLSALPRGQNIPAGAGAVDVKAIYDGVREGLAAFETVRRAPASMLLADAEMKAKTAEAPLGTRQVLAQTEGIEQQTPLKTAILAADASPEMLAAKMQALQNRGARPLTGVPYLLHRMDELRAGDQTDPGVVAAIAETQQKLTEARDIATARNATTTAVGAGRDATSAGNAAAAEAGRTARAEAADARIRELADSVETMKRDLATQAQVAAQKRTETTVNAPAKRTDAGLQHSDNLEKAESALRAARKSLEAAADDDADAIANAQNEISAASIQRDVAQKAYDLFHAERTKKVADDGTARLAAAIAARGKGVSPAPATQPPAISSSGPATPAELVAAVKAKTMTPDQAKAYATSKGWK